jgi:hypothetical protein
VYPDAPASKEQRPNISTVAAKVIALKPAVRKQ